MKNVGIDSNILTYFINASDANYDFTKNNSVLAKEYKAIIQGYLYVGKPYILVPTVSAQYKRISDAKKKKNHETVAYAIFIDGPFNLDSTLIDKRKKVLKNKHLEGDEDCQILAEAELSNLNYLLTCDNDFIKHLSSETNGISIMKPSSYIKTLKIIPGQTPKILPDSSNHLYNKTGWKI
ncbi:MAG: hypothetical protein JW869_03700 [Candidatus Omnitrophica bacterium]|nr:hypothetical protein [Candidatus Omnitrophota bacterium]